MWLKVGWCELTLFFLFNLIRSNKLLNRLTQKVRFKKNSTSSPWKRRKTSPSAIFCATGAWGLRHLLIEWFKPIKGFSGICVRFRWVQFISWKINDIFFLLEIASGSGSGVTYRPSSKITAIAPYLWKTLRSLSCSSEISRRRFSSLSFSLISPNILAFCSIGLARLSRTRLISLKDWKSYVR